MILEKFGRILLPLITPFNDDYSVNYDVAKKIARFVVEKNYCDSLIVTGTTGEFYALTVEERIRLFEAIKEEIGDEVPLIAGTGSIFVNEAIEMTKKVEELGYDAAMVVVPYYCRPTQEGIYEHFKAVAESTSLPVMIYNIPLFVNQSIHPDTAAKLSEIPNIVAIKEEAGINPLQTTEFIKKSEGKLTAYSGDDLMILQVMNQGGVGVVSGGAHIVGDLIRDMIEAFNTGDNPKAVELNQILYDVFTGFGGPEKKINPTPLVKAAFEMISGLPTSRVRPPLLTAPAKDREYVENILKKINKL